jgi:hypothetical protein
VQLLARARKPEVPSGAEIGGTRVHSVRLPGFVVSTEVVFGGPGERLVMRHDPGLAPAPYVAGTLLTGPWRSLVRAARCGGHLTRQPLPHHFSLASAIDETFPWLIRAWW